MTEPSHDLPSEAHAAQLALNLGKLPGAARR